MKFALCKMATVHTEAGWTKPIVDVSSAMSLGLAECALPAPGKNCAMLGRQVQSHALANMALSWTLSHAHALMEKARGLDQHLKSASMKNRTATRAF